MACEPVTRVDLADDEIVRLYGKQWDIEVFFKMMKHYLNLERETQLRDYDGIVGNITIAMTRYIFLAFEQRCHDDPRTLSTLFFACSDEMKDLSLVKALQRLLSLAMKKTRHVGIVAEDVLLALVNTIMGTAIDMLETRQRFLKIILLLRKVRPSTKLDFKLSTFSDHYTGYAIVAIAYL